MKSKPTSQRRPLFRLQEEPLLINARLGYISTKQVHKSDVRFDASDRRMYRQARSLAYRPTSMDLRAESQLQ